MRTLASAIPQPFSLGTVLPSELRSTIREACSLFIPHGTTGTAAPQAVTLETAEERDERERLRSLPIKTLGWFRFDGFSKHVRCQFDGFTPFVLSYAVELFQD